VKLSTPRVLARDSYGLIKPDKMAEGFTELEVYRAKEQAKSKSNVVAMR